MEIIAMRAYVSGKVQGVCFREYTRRKAVELGIDGWVRNLSDGRVEVLAQGERALIQEFIKWLHVGSPYAQVSHVETKREDCLETMGFSILF